jgi:Holliday junction resolvase RusA-like endonuclease
MTKRGRAYTPKETTDEQDRIAGLWDGPSFDGPVAVWVEYDKEGQLITVQDVTWTSPLRGDIDNYMKLTMDALQVGGAIVNDRQVVRLWGDKL